MSKNPAFLFYPNDFIAGTNLMTNEQVGKYIRLLCYQYGQGHLSEEDMIVVCGSYDKKIFSKFKQDEDGNYYNERLEEEMLKRQKYCDAQTKNVKKRWGNNDTTVYTVVDTTVLPTNIPSGNENINEDINNIDNDNNNLYFQRFNIFWEKYPKKRDKERALCAFLRIKPSEELFEQIMNALEIQKRCAQWQDNQYIPYPATWLNGKRWEDEIPDGEVGSFDTDDFFQDALKRSYGK